MKYQALVLATILCAAISCAHHAATTKPTDATTTQPSFSEHDQIIIGLLEHFDFGDGTLADMSDQEFEEMIRSDEDFKTKFDENASDAHIVALFREARRRALEEGTAAPTIAQATTQSTPPPTR